MAGAVTLGNIANAIGPRAEEASIVAELKAGSEEAYNWLIGRYHQPIYSLVHRILTDPADAADTTQEVFLKVFRGIKRFNGQCRLETWLYRIAIHEAYRTTVVLRDIEGTAYEEIAEVRRISLGTVKSRLIRGREALKKRLESFVSQMGADVKHGAAAPQPSASRPGQLEVEAKS